MAEDQQEVLKHHLCKFCNRRFPCGRSLGGHMRSHLINQSETNSKKKKLSSISNGNPNLGIEYVLGENPKKTTKFAESSSTENDTLLHPHNKVCRECGKSFCSWKALFGHMKCHSERILFRSGIESDSWNVVDSHSGSEEVKNAPNRKKRLRSRIKRSMANATTTNSSSLTAENNNASPYVSVNVVDEQEEVALSLIMLSRNVGSLGGQRNSVPACSDNNSERLGARKQDSKCKKLRNEKVESAENLKNSKSRAFGIPRSGGSKMNILKDSCKLLDDRIGIEQSEAELIRNTTLNSPVDSDHQKDSLNKKRQLELDDVNECSKKLADHKPGYQDSEKKTRFECSTCNKNFHSYQALGGHRASHKKAKGCENSADQTNEHNPSPNKNADSTDDKNNLEFLAEKVETSKKYIKAHHECPICFRNFPSGQALGGHKRSHLIAEAKSIQPIEMQKPAVPGTRDFLDLNLPAPTEEEDDDDDEDQESHHSVGLQAWWMTESSHKHKQLVGPTF